MGKKSLLSSTSKKEADSKSDEGKEKKTKTAAGSIKKAGKTAAGKKSAAGTAASKKAAPKKKAAATRASADKAGTKPKAATAAGKKRPGAKTTAARRKPVSIKELLSKKFDISVPEKRYAPPGNSARGGEISSPPFAVGATPEETERIRRLLFKKFDRIPSDAEPDPVPEALSTDMSPPAAAVAKEDYNIDTSDGPAMESKGVAPAKKKDATQKAMLIGILGLVVLLCLIVGASMKNTAKYYLKPAAGELEIWKGRFSPMGAKKFAALSATPMPAEPKEVYGKDEIFPFIFESYLNRADALLNASDMPDFELIKRTLNNAKAFAVSSEFGELIQRRLSKIDLMTLVYKADILADKNSAEDLASARKALEKAMRLNLDEAEKGLVNQKLQWIDERQAQLERMETD